MSNVVRRFFKDKDGSEFMKKGEIESELKKNEFDLFED